jgi:hypothetical protein
MAQQHKMTKHEAGRIGGKITAIRRRAESLKQYYINPNKCKRCGKIIQVKENQQVADVRKNKYCSHSCAAQTLGTMKKDRTCLFCNNKINGPGLKYCNNICQNNYQKQLFIEKWKKGEIKGYKGIKSKRASSYIRAYLFDKYHNACQKCNWGVINPYTKFCYLEVHHKDGDIENTSEKNLELLCPNCHSLTKNYKNIKIRSKRFWRRK